MENNLVSILLPVFNAEKTIDFTINSVGRQSYQQWELIQVDDSCTDKSIEILQKYADKDSRIHIIKNAYEKGIVGALNTAIDNAKGQWCARIDADDMMLPDRLEFQVTQFRRDPALKLCAGHATVVDDSNKPVGIGINSAPGLDELDSMCCVVHPSVMWDNQFFIDNNLRYEKQYEWAEDLALWLKFRLTGGKYGAINKPLIYYRIGNDRISSTKSSEQKKIVKKIYSDFNIAPYLSIIQLGSQPIETQINHEVIKNVKDAKGQFIAFTKFKNNPKRFEKQIQFLKNSPTIVGCGSYIKTAKSNFFYQPDSQTIEKQLFKGKIIIEQGSFTYKNLGVDAANFFELLCKLDTKGDLVNGTEPLVEVNEYKAVEQEFTSERSKIARDTILNKVINIVHLNITSEGNFSGVDRYIKTMRSGYPDYVKASTITLVASSRVGLDMEGPHDAKFYYNPQQMPLDHLNNMLWDSLKTFFEGKENLIVQSNCFNLYEVITFIRTKVKLSHVCMCHCIPYRETIRSDPDTYRKLETRFNDKQQDFNESTHVDQAINLSDYVILNTHDAEQWYNRVGYVRPATFIPNCVDKLFTTYNEYNPDKPFKFIFVGHSSPLKGMNDLIPVIERVKQKYNIEVHWAGSPGDITPQIIQKNNLPIKIHGVLNTNDLNKLYSECNAQLIQTKCETCCMAALEAMSAGLPIIATKAHGVTELVDNVGLLVPWSDGIMNFDAELYYQQMVKVIEDADLRKSMTDRGLEKVSEFYTEKIVEESIAFYKDVLKLS